VCAARTNVADSLVHGEHTNIKSLNPAEFIENRTGITLEFVNCGTESYQNACRKKLCCSKAEHQFLFALLILQFAKSILVVFFFPRLRSVSSERNQCSAIKSYSILDYKAAPVNYGHFILHARALSLSLLLGVFTKANETLFRSVPQLSAFFCAFFLAPQKLNSPSLSSLFTRLHTKRQRTGPPFLVMLETLLVLLVHVERVCNTLFKPCD